MRSPIGSSTIIGNELSLLSVHEEPVYITFCNYSTGLNTRAHYIAMLFSNSSANINRLCLITDPEKRKYIDEQDLCLVISPVHQYISSFQALSLHCFQLRIPEGLWMHSLLITPWISFLNWSFPVGFFLGKKWWWYSPQVILLQLIIN